MIYFLKKEEKKLEKFIQWKNFVESYSGFFLQIVKISRILKIGLFDYNS